MIEGLLRLVPRSIVPAAVSFLLWFGTVYGGIAENFYQRATRKNVTEAAREIVANARNRNVSISEEDALIYARCVYDTLWQVDGFRMDYSVYLATFGMIDGEVLRAREGRLAAIDKSGVCGGGQWW